MERFLLAKLKEWKEKPDRKPRILKGVRQCGKEIVPTEVRSEKNVMARFLAESRKKFLPCYAVRPSMCPDTDGGEVLNVPLYMIGSMIKRFL